jgi:uncharacterized protein (TIGR02284 family)
MKTKLYAGGRKTLHVLNDLIRINIDRITAFEKAAHEEQTPDAKLREAFYRMAIEGRSNVNDLHARVIRMGGAPVNQATITGKIYLRWLEAHANFDGSDTAAQISDTAAQISDTPAQISDTAAQISACIVAGRATEEAYHHALEELLPGELQELVENQLRALRQTHQRLAALSG